MSNETAKWEWSEFIGKLPYALAVPPKYHALIALAPTMAAMLSELEWRGSPAGNECPICEYIAPRTVNVPGEPIAGMPGMARYTGETRQIPGGHAPGCTLDALLTEVGRG